jgi:SAM-dependent methyltransferase
LLSFATVITRIPARRKRSSVRFKGLRRVRTTGSSTLDAGAAGVRNICDDMDGGVSSASIATPILSTTQGQPIPGVEFCTCDVLDVPGTVGRDFDVVYMLSAFYAFANQRDALLALRKVAKPRARLVIFDYAIGREADLSVEGQVFIPHPIRLSEISTTLRDANWNAGSVEDLSADYARWYTTFVERIGRKQREIEEIGGAEWYRFVLSMYSGLRDAIASGTIGGAIVHAIAV